MNSISKLPLLVVVALGLAWNPVSGQVIALPNGDFNDNSDGDLAVIDGWTTAGGNNPGSNVNVIQVDGASGRDPGDLVARLGVPNSFQRLTTFGVGQSFDTNAPGYRISVEARAFAEETLSNDDPVSDTNWGFLFRDVTNGNNIKTASQPNPIDQVWRDYSLFLSIDELLAYGTDNGVDVNSAEIGIRFFKNNPTTNFIAVDNVVLELAAPPVPGDVDGNGLVELADYAVIRDNQLLSPANVSQGDVFPFDGGDGVVDLADFTYWKAEFLAAGGTEAQIAAFNAIPEPTALALAASLALVGVRRR